MFKILKQSKISRARAGLLKTPHGVIKTPFFMPVATRGAVKHVSGAEMKKLGAQILLSNTYHLMLKPGEKLVKKAGGLRAFMGWPGPLLTDSGGFQVFSLSGAKNKSGKSLVRISPRGVFFNSHIDGREFYLTPERSLEIQLALGVDIAVCLDVCAALPAKRPDLERAVRLTTAWAARTKKYYLKYFRPSAAIMRPKGQSRPLLFAVIQGGLKKDLRLKSLRELLALDFDGYNIGGLSVGETAREMYKVLDYLAPALPAGKPRYLMGVGYPENIVEAVKRGVDMFDCVIPTREGRHGRLFLRKRNYKLQIIDYKKISNTKKQNSNIFYGTISITNAKFASDFSAINAGSKIPELCNLSKAYLHYLFKINEPLGQRLASLNNLEFYLDLMKALRQAVLAGKL